MNNYDKYLSNTKVLFDPKSLSNKDQFEISKKSKHYRYLWMSIVVFGLFCFQMIPYAITQNLISPISSNVLTGWLSHNILLVNIFLALIFLGIALCGPLAGNWFSRSKKIKHIYIISFLITGISFICFSIAYLTKGSNLAGTAVILYIFSITMGAGISIFSNVGIAQLVNRWFPPSQKGFALGIVFMGGSLGTIIFSPALKAMEAQQWIQDSEYFIFVIFGVLSIVAGILFTLIIVRQPLPVYEINQSETIKTAGNNVMTNVDSVSVAQAKRYPYYYILLFGWLIYAFGLGILITQAQQTTNGLIGLANQPYNNASASNIPDDADLPNKQLVLNITTVYGVSCLFGNFLGGKLNDKIGSFRAFSLGITLMLIATLAILFSPLGESYLPYLWAIFSGLGVYSFTSTPSYISGNLFGAKHSPKHLGNITLFLYGGVFVGLIVSGLVAGTSGLQDGKWDNVHQFLNVDISGNWTAVWIMCICFIFVGASLILIGIFHMKHLGVSGINNYYHSSYSKLLQRKHGWFIFQLKIAIIFTKRDLTETNWFKNYLQKHCQPFDNIKKQSVINILDKELKVKLEKYLKLKTNKENKLQKLLNKNTSKTISNTKTKAYATHALKLMKKYETILPVQIANTKSNFKKYYYVMNYLNKIENAQFLENKFEIIKSQNKQKFDNLIKLNESEYLRLVDLTNKANDKLKNYYDNPSAALKAEYLDLVKKYYETKERNYDEKLNKLMAKKAKNDLHFSKLVNNGNDNQVIKKEQ